MQKKFFVIVFNCVVLLSFLSGMSNSSDNTKLSNQKALAVNILSSCISDTNPYIRKNAIEVIANTKCSQLAPKIEKMLADDYVPVRFSAAIALGEIDYTKAKLSLKKLIQLGDEMSKIAAEFSLAKMGEINQIPIIKSALNSSDKSLKANAIMLLGKLGDKSNLELLYAILKDKNESDAVMFNAVEAIASLKDDRIYERLWTMLISKYADDRIFGIKAMGDLGNKQAKDALLTMLYDEILEVRLAAAIELGKLNNQAGFPDVYDALTKPLSQIQAERVNNNVKDSNIAAAKSSPDYWIQPEPETIARVKVLAAMAIGYIKNDKLNQFLPSLLSDQDVNVRLAAAQSAMMVED